ncbi:MAG: hypothetical protein ACLRTA_01840 [Clostridia bacterium]
MKEIINISIPKSRFKQKIKQANGTVQPSRHPSKEAGAYKYHTIVSETSYKDIERQQRPAFLCRSRSSCRSIIGRRTERMSMKIRVMPKELYKSYGNTKTTAGRDSR